MPLDGLTLHFLKAELSLALIDSRVDKIYQPSRDELVFLLRKREGSMRLLVSASANCPRIHLTKYAPENPAQPPMLCMLLRKNLGGAAITSIRQQGLDRIMFVDFAGTNEIGDKTSFTLAVEIMAKHSNIILINENGIVTDSVKRIDMTQSSVRQILPGTIYQLPPPQNKLNLLETDAATVCSRVLSCGGKRLSGALLETVEGMSPLVAREIAMAVSADDEQVENLTESAKGNLLSKLENLKKTLDGNIATPFILKKDGGNLFDFSFTDITQYGFSVESVEMNGFSEMLDEFYYEKDLRERTRQRSSSLLKLLGNSVSRLSRKIETQKAELKECEKKDEIRKYGELILANQYSLSKGVPFYDILDYYTGENIRIKADPALSPGANAQKYFKEYRKLKTAEQLLGGLIENGEQELVYLESVIDSIERAEGFTELGEIRAELYDSGYLKRAKQEKGKRHKPMPPLEYISDDGYRILVGRNNIQNDALTFKTARKDDSWFHASKMPGSHVVVCGEGEIIPETTVRQAAALAAYHSSGRFSSRVPVDYTEVRELKKPAGAKPGKVIYHTYNTMWAVPDRTLCERLKNKK
ncbi:MAG: NFACT family protein [Clostridia bacterium]|nr:NFACT family protein [Clostridia bacterium]